MEAFLELCKRICGFFSRKTHPVSIIDTCKIIPENFEECDGDGGYDEYDDINDTYCAIPRVQERVLPFPPSHVPTIQGYLLQQPLDDKATDTDTQH
jgi:hypothetical protein